MVTKIGWLQQNLSVKGGAEMSTGALIKYAPKWAEVVYCPENKRPPEDIDLFVIQNSTVYSSVWIEELALKPVIRHVRDPWFAGSALLRNWLLQNADLFIFSSPVQHENFRYKVDPPVKYIPVPIDLEPFRKAGLPEEERSGNICVGRFDVYKGAPYIIDWALRNEEPLTVVGDNRYMSFGQLPNFIRFLGEVPYEAMPELLGKHKRYLAMPVWTEAFGRSVAEAWASGCELVTQGDIGALWWIENEPDRLGLENPVSEFWEAVAEVAGRG